METWVILSIVAAIIVLIMIVIAIFIVIRTHSSQVYLYYNKAHNASDLHEASAIARKYSGTVASPAQLLSSQKAGASWCAAGFASDGNVYWPQQQNPLTGCGTTGINKMTCSAFGGNCGVLIYGRKPDSSDKNIYAFNDITKQWSQWKWYNPFH